MAGGANAINMWFDRDIDTRMSRTRLRPIPRDGFAPGSGWRFGVTLGLAAFAVFWYRVNPLSAWLALGGLLFYVFVYTIWLKRTSPQNIVIGGAAGAFPPLVGWAAMTGPLDLAALYLFAIIFYWTPPHFWALALIKQADYARAGIPMMPVVRGERPDQVRDAGLHPDAAAAHDHAVAVRRAGPVLRAWRRRCSGARLLWYCIRLLRERSSRRSPGRCTATRLLYLALLFAAMGIDRALPFGHCPAERARSVIILDQPDDVDGDARARGASVHP